MSRFFPHSTYAEDQPLAHTLLYTHVIHRGMQTGALFGLLTGTTRSLLAARRTSLATVQPALFPQVLRTTGYGALIGAGALGVLGTVARMWGREEIEWKDRSWRLLENKGQVECDDWSVAGLGVGAVAAVVTESGNAAPGRALRILGGAGLGNLAGVGGYMLWRYVIKGGKRDE